MLRADKYQDRTFLRPNVLSTAAFGAAFGWSFFFGGIAFSLQQKLVWDSTLFQTAHKSVTYLRYINK